MTQDSKKIVSKIVKENRPAFMRASNTPPQWIPNFEAGVTFDASNGLANDDDDDDITITSLTRTLPQSTCDEDEDEYHPPKKIIRYLRSLPTAIKKWSIKRFLDNFCEEYDSSPFDIEEYTSSTNSISSEESYSAISSSSQRETKAQPGDDVVLDSSNEADTNLNSASEFRHDEEELKILNKFSSKKLGLPDYEDSSSETEYESKMINFDQLDEKSLKKFIKSSIRTECLMIFRKFLSEIKFDDEDNEVWIVTYPRFLKLVKKAIKFLFQRIKCPSSTLLRNITSVRERVTYHGKFFEFLKYLEKMKLVRLNKVADNAYGVTFRFDY